MKKIFIMIMLFFCLACWAKPSLRQKGEELYSAAMCEDQTIVDDPDLKKRKGRWSKSYMCGQIKKQLKKWNFVLEAEFWLFRNDLKDRIEEDLLGNDHFIDQLSAEQFIRFEKAVKELENH